MLLPTPARRPPLMVGSAGTRVLAATLPHVETWNTWFDWYGNTADGFLEKKREIDEACERAGRDPSSIERSACVLIRLGDANASDADEEGVTPARRIAGRDPRGLRAMADAGADELILVLDPITEASIRTVGDIVQRLRT